MASLNSKSIPRKSATVVKFGTICNVRVIPVEPPEFSKLGSILMVVVGLLPEVILYPLLNLVFTRTPVVDIVPEPILIAPVVEGVILLIITLPVEVLPPIVISALEFPTVKAVPIVNDEGSNLTAFELPTLSWPALSPETLKFAISARAPPAFPS